MSVSPPIAIMILGGFAAFLILLIHEGRRQARQRFSALKDVASHFSFEIHPPQQASILESVNAYTTESFLTKIDSISAVFCFLSCSRVEQQQTSDLAYHVVFRLKKAYPFEL